MEQHLVAESKSNAKVKFYLYFLAALYFGRMAFNTDDD